MRLAFLTTINGAPWGGSEELWSQTALRLRGEGHAVLAIFDASAHGPIAPPAFATLAGAGVELHAWRPPVVRTTVGRLAGIARDTLQHRRVLRPRTDPRLTALRAFRPDLVIVSSGAISIGPDWMAVVEAAGVPFVLIGHGVNETTWPGDSELEQQAAYYAACRRAYVVSQASREIALLQFAPAPDKLRIVVNPCRNAQTPPPPWPAATPDFRLAAIGRLDPGTKGCDLLLRALARPTWRDRPFSLSFFGTGPAARNVQRMTAQLGLADRVQFRGHTDDLSGLWAQHHLLVVASRHEGLPLVVVEACWAARPAVVTAMGGSREMVEEGVTGFIAAGATVDALSAALDRAWDARTRWPEMGQAARRLVETRLPRDPIGVFAQELLELATA